MYLIVNTLGSHYIRQRPSAVVGWHCQPRLSGDVYRATLSVRPSVTSRYCM